MLRQAKGAGFSHFHCKAETRSLIFNSHTDYECDQLRSRNYCGVCVDGFGHAWHDEKDQDRELPDSVALGFWHRQSERIYSILSPKIRMPTMPPLNRYRKATSIAN